MFISHTPRGSAYQGKLSRETSGKTANIGRMGKEPQEIEKRTSRKKNKRRPPRLTGVSKQRKMANERERRRVQALNTHIENLRELIPLSPYEKRPTKTEVIWMAATYIEFLTELLQKTEKPVDTTTSENAVDVVHVSQSLDLTLIDVTGQT